jgi:hypothetical protein
MLDPIVFFHIEDPAKHPVTSCGYKTFDSGGVHIVYCTDAGPLDEKYRDAWVKWKTSEASKQKATVVDNREEASRHRARAAVDDREEASDRG